MTAMAPLPEAERLQRQRVEFGDGAGTAVRVASFPRSGFRARVVRISPVGRLKQWSTVNGVADAVVGGFFNRKKRHSYLGWLSPAEFEDRACPVLTETTPDTMGGPLEKVLLKADQDQTAEEEKDGS